MTNRSDHSMHVSSSKSKMGRKSEVSLEERKAVVVHDLQRMLRSIPARKDRTNESLQALQQFVDNGNPYASKSRSKALVLNQGVLKSCEEEVEYLRKLLSDIEKLKQLEYKSKTQMPIKRHTLMQLLGDQAASLPLYVGGVDGFPPHSVGGIELPLSSSLKVGDAVAALVEDNWILAEVQAALPGGKFDIKDVDDEQNTRVIIPRVCLIPLPKYRADPTRDAHALFPKDAIVLALYPQTTCFYRGFIHKTPENALEPYMITFEDSSYTQGFSPPMPVHQRYVVTYRDAPDPRNR